MNLRAAIYAGIAAGTVATIAQIVLWWIFKDVLPWIIYRDARLTAAIALGHNVLSPPATFNGLIIFVATLIHFILSIAYSTILAYIIARYSAAFSLLLGTIYGLALYGINMYGFTVIFPWFTETRDWITMITHIVFGISVAGIYKVLFTLIPDEKTREWQN